MLDCVPRISFIIQFFFNLAYTWGTWPDPYLTRGPFPWGPPQQPPPWAATPPSIVFRRPMDAMVDLTNDLAVTILQDYSHTRSNFAFSPYGVASVLVVLYEGARGESARQIHVSGKFPWDRDITRIGFRDIHRHLRSYFSHEGYLSGITLNKEASSLRPEYKKVLRFYGYDVDINTPSIVDKPPEKPVKEIPVTTPSSNTSENNVKEMPEEMVQTATSPQVNNTTLSLTSTTLTTSVKGELTTETSFEVTNVTALSPVDIDIRTSAITVRPLDLATTLKTEIVTATVASDLVVPTSSTESTIKQTEASVSNVEPVTSSSLGPSSMTAVEMSTAISGGLDNGMLIPQPEDISPLTTEAALKVEAPEVESRENSNDLLSRTTDQDTTVESETDATTTTEQEEEASVSLETTTTNFPDDLTLLNTTDSPPLEETTIEKSDDDFKGAASDVKYSIRTLDEYLLSKDVSLNNNEPPERGVFLSSLNEPFFPKTLDEILAQRDYFQYSDNRDDERELVPKTLDELLLLRHKRMMRAKKPIRYATSVDVRKLARRLRTRRTITDFLRLPSVPEMSLQLQNGMFDSHMSRRADLYRPLPRLPFLIDGSLDTPVPMMTYTNVFPFAYIPRLHSAALEFPLDDERYKLLIILPAERRGLRQLTYDLNSVSLRAVMDSLKPTKIRAVVPTFMVEGFVILTPALQRMGIWNVFDPRRANLSGMSTDPDLYVRNIEQSVTVVIRNFVEILDIQTRTMAARQVEQEFVATHPFLYFILDSETNVALMAGQMLDPLNSRIY